MHPSRVGQSFGPGIEARIPNPSGVGYMHPSRVGQSFGPSAIYAGDRQDLLHNRENREIRQREGFGRSPYGKQHRYNGFEPVTVTSGGVNVISYTATSDVSLFDMTTRIRTDLSRMGIVEPYCIKISDGAPSAFQTSTLEAPFNQGPYLSPTDLQRLRDHIRNDIPTIDIKVPDDTDGDEIRAIKLGDMFSILEHKFDSYNANPNLKFLEGDIMFTISRGPCGIRGILG